MLDEAIAPDNASTAAGPTEATVAATTAAFAAEPTPLPGVTDQPFPCCESQVASDSTTAPCA